jgi:hypothetical protein
MTVFEVIRKDIYIVEVEAKDEREARRKVETEDNYLNDGEFCESEFGDIVEARK